MKVQSEDNTGYPAAITYPDRFRHQQQFCVEGFYINISGPGETWSLLSCLASV